MRGPIPGVSIIITSYNYARYIGRAIESASAQDVPGLEIVIVDNASTDESWDVISKAAARDTRIRAYQNQTNIGMVANHLRGLELATNDAVLMLSADDYLLPGQIARLVSAHAEHHEIDYFFTSYVHVDEQDHLIRFLGHIGHPRGSYFGGRNEFADLLAYDCYACTPTTLWNRSDMLNHSSEGGVIAGDYDNYLRLCASGATFGFIDAAGVAVRIHPHEITGEERYVATGKQFLEQLTLLERHLTPANLHRIAGREQSVMNLVLAKINNLQKYPEVAGPTLEQAQSRVDAIVQLLNTSRQTYLSTPLGATPPISLIMCANNDLAANLATVESLNRQDYAQWNVVLVTDTSHDITPFLLDRLRGRAVRVMYHRGALAPAISFNDGIVLADGEIITYCKPGDVFASCHLTRIARHFSCNQIEALRSAAGLWGFAHRRAVVDRFGRFNETLATGAEAEFVMRICNSVTTGTEA